MRTWAHYLTLKFCCSWGHNKAEGWRQISFLLESTKVWSDWRGSPTFDNYLKGLVENVLAIIYYVHVSSKNLDCCALEAFQITICYHMKVSCGLMTVLGIKRNYQFDLSSSLWPFIKISQVTIIYNRPHPYAYWNLVEGTLGCTSV